MTRLFTVGRLQRAAMVLTIAGLIALGGGILGALTASAGGPPVTAPTTGPGPFYAGPVHECVAGESTAYFELHSTALGNCARGYTQLTVNELTPSFSLQLGSTVYACQAVTARAETAITCSPPSPAPSPSASSSSPPAG